MKIKKSQQSSDACKEKLEAINDLNVLQQLRLSDTSYALNKAFYEKYPYEPNDPYRNFWNSDAEMTAQAKMNELDDKIDATGFRIQKAVDAATAAQDPTGVWDYINAEMDNIIWEVNDMIEELKK